MARRKPTPGVIHGTISASVPVEVVKAVSTIAEAEGRTRSGAVSQLIEEALAARLGVSVEDLLKCLNQTNAS